MELPFNDKRQTDRDDVTLSVSANASYELAAIQPNAIIGGRFRVIKLLGVGGMGAVYEAEDIAIKRKVALKLLLPALAWNPLDGTGLQYLSEMPDLSTLRIKGCAQVRAEAIKALQKARPHLKIEFQLKPSFF